MRFNLIPKLKNKIDCSYPLRVFVRPKMKLKSTVMNCAANGIARRCYFIVQIICWFFPPLVRNRQMFWLLWKCRKNQSLLIYFNNDYENSRVQQSIQIKQCQQQLKIWFTLSSIFLIDACSSIIQTDCSVWVSLKIRNLNGDAYCGVLQSNWNQLSLFFIYTHSHWQIVKFTYNDTNPHTINRIACCFLFGCCARIYG